MEDKREKAIRRIKKLLALSGSINEQEAIAATEMAQKLMREYQLSDEAIADYNKSDAANFEEKNALTDEEFKNWRVTKTRQSMISAIAKFCGCKIFYQPTPRVNRNGRIVWENMPVYFGFRTNIEYAAYLTIYLFRSQYNAYETEKKRVRAINKEAGFTRLRKPDNKSFYFGFSQGVSRKMYDLLETERKELEDASSQGDAKASTALMIIDNKKLDAAWENRSSGFRSMKTGYTGKLTCSYETGFNAGKNVNLNRGIGRSTKRISS